MSLSTQPYELTQGETGEWVQHLQERLQALGHYDGYVDGTYGEKTDAAVKKLQEAVGHDQDGRVVPATWDALTDHEQRHGIFTHSHGQHGNGHDQYGQYGHGQYGHDQYGQYGHDQYGQHGQHGHDQYGQHGHDQQSVHDYVGQLSPDGQHRWNGHDWEPVHTDHHQHAQGVQHAQPHGEQHRSGHSDHVGQLSPDGQHRWNGHDWEQVHTDHHLRAQGEHHQHVQGDHHQAAQPHTDHAMQPHGSSSHDTSNVLHPAILEDDELSEFARFFAAQYA